MIFFVIIILIGLTYYDLKYSIIFCIILYLVYLYFNKLTYESNYDEYKQYDEEINNILRNIEVYREYDNQNYKLGLKYHNNVLKNIKLLNDIHEKLYFQSILEKTRIFLEKMIEKFNSILFSIEDIDKSEKLNKLIINLNNKFNKLINDTIFIYNNRIKDLSDCDNGMFCNEDLILNLYLNDDDKYIYNSKPKVEHNIFDRGKYIGIEKGNEVDYHLSKGFNESSLSMTMTMNRSDMIPRKGFTDLDDLDPIEDSNKNPYNSEMYNASWSHINYDRNANEKQQKFYKSKIDALMNKMSNDSSKTAYYEDQIDNIRNEYLNIYNN